MFPQIIKGLLVWGFLGAMLYGICLSLVGRAVGLDAGAFSGCLALVLSVVVAALVMIPLAMMVGARGGQAVWSMVSQAVGILATSWAVKKVFHTDWPRAVLTVLLAAILMSVVSAIVLLVIF